MTYAIEIKGLKKVYQHKTVALNDVSLRVKKGDFFGLLGLNGAGKTTLISILTGLVRPTAGSVSVLGHDLVAEPYMAKRLASLVPQEINMNIFNTVKEVMFNHGGFYGMTRSEIALKYEDILRDLRLLHKQSATVKSLSGGMKRRLLIARALLANPGVLVLDEPTAGVDVELRQDIWQMLKRVNQAGTTIVLTTHYMEEAEHLCENFAILHQGKIIHEGDKSSLTSESQARHLILHLQSSVTALPSVTGVEAQQKDDKSLSLTLTPDASLSDYLKALEAEDMILAYVSSPTNRLEQYFRRRTGHEAR